MCNEELEKQIQQLANVIMLSGIDIRHCDAIAIAKTIIEKYTDKFILKDNVNDK